MCRAGVLRHRNTCELKIEGVKTVISGGASGLGRHFALKLLAVGATVAVCDVSLNGLAELKKAASPLKGRLFLSEVDISSESAVVEFVCHAAKYCDGLNTVINNAGILRDGVLVEKQPGWIKKMPAAQWQTVLDVNLTGAYLLTREVVAHMLEHQRKGVIVNISSISGAGNIGQSNYSASKAGLDACTRTWALELACHGIRVAGIAPGLIETPMLENISSDTLAALKKEIPLGRIGIPHDIWVALKFVLECDYFTGRVLCVDGGYQF